MTEHKMYEAKIDLSKICMFPDEEKEGTVMIGRNRKPVRKETLSDSSPRQKLFGAGKGLFTVPENFDDIDISGDFEGEMFPG